VSARTSEATPHLYFAATIFAGATLLFLCQPMIARMIVPLLGGAPSVWIVCSLCFQMLLLAGYGYAHFVSTRLRVPAQVVLHMCVLASVFLVMPVAVDEALVERLTASHRTLGLLLLLLRTIGLPFFVLSTSSPLLQRWFAELGERDPYHLYAASNAGSMVALLGYPLVVEPLLAVKAQARALHVAFAVYTVLVVVCAVRAVRRPSPARIETTPAPPQVRYMESEPRLPVARSARQRWGERFLWLGLSFVPSSLLLGSTEFVTNDIASVPFLWVLPLALYLMSFIVAFAKKEVIKVQTASRLTGLLTAVVAGLTLADVTGPPWIVIGAHMLLLFFASVVCHRVLAERRPDVLRLTEFYLLLSIGGVLGGAFNGLLAPLLFDDLYEYPIAIALACLPRISVDAERWRRQTLVRDVAFALVLGALLVFGMHRRGDLGSTVWADRGFYGVLKVVRDRESRFMLLVSGRALHGKQALEPSRANVPLAYYHPTGPAGDVLGPLPTPGSDLPSRRVGIIGLGVGSLAAYARPGDDWTFFELNPAVVDVAREQFTYVKRAESVASVHIDVGDARQHLRRTEPERFDVLVLDAFGEGAVPTHLVTREALAVYRRAMRRGGVLLVHVTNDDVRLAPVFAALAKDAGMLVIERKDDAVPPDERAAGKAPSEWLVLTESRPSIDTILRGHEGWHVLAPPASQSVWTDDYANVLGALRF
jgi:hypothetical protein